MDQQVEVKKPRALVANKVKPHMIQIPTDILEDEVLNEFIKALPKNYNFEIHKSIWRINEMKKILGKEVSSQS